MRRLCKPSRKAHSSPRGASRRPRLHRIGVGVHLAVMHGRRRGAGTASVRSSRLDVVYFSGTAAADKGTNDLVAAMRLLWAEGRDTTLVLTGPMLSQARAFFDSLPPEEAARIRLLGFVDKKTQADILAAADVLALPSRTDSFGIVFLDAWANGKPVIGANAGGIPGVISDGVDGLLVPFGDVISACSRDPALAG